MDILGVSHAVLGAERPEAVIDRFATRGYRVAARRPSLANPPERARYVAGPMRPTADVTLMLSEPPSPALEIVHEPGPPGTVGESSAFAWMENDPLAVMVHCLNLDQALRLWRALRIEPVPLANGMRRVDVRRSLVGTSLSLYYVESRREIATTWLNQRGLVCLGLFCRDLAIVRERLAASGLDPGEAFELSPFGQPLRLFIVRNRSGELFEFVSVGGRST